MALFFAHENQSGCCWKIMASNVRHSLEWCSSVQGTIPTWRPVSAIFSLVNGFISVRFTEWNVWDMDGMLTGCYQWVPPKKVVFLGTIMILYDGLLVGIWWDILIYQDEVIGTDCDSLECWLVGGNYPKMAEVWRFVQRNGVYITHTIPQIASLFDKLMMNHWIPGPYIYM